MRFIIRWSKIIAASLRGLMSQYHNTASQYKPWCLIQRYNYPYSHASFQRGPIFRDFTNSTAMIAAEHDPDLNLKTNTPHPALTGEPRGASCEEIQEGWLWHNGTSLYYIN